MNNHYLIPNWTAPASVKAYATTRLGGVSLPPFDSLNLSFNVGDEDKLVNANQQKLIEDLNLPTPPIWLNQVHGNEVLELEDFPSEMDILSGDATITRKKNLVCAIRTADCLPILLCNQQGTQIAAIHAGWRGLASGIIFKTLEKFCDNKFLPKFAAARECEGGTERRTGAYIEVCEDSRTAPTHKLPDAVEFPKRSNATNEILAWLGPAIGPQIYEVDEKVKIALSHFLSDEESKLCFQLIKPTTGPTKYLTNLYKIARFHLARCGVQKVSGGEYCTYTQSDLFFSYRKAYQLNPFASTVLTGRMASLIWIT